jgi:hypothetical protein
VVRTHAFAVASSPKVKISPPHISEKLGHRRVFAGAVAMLLVLGVFLAASGLSQADAPQGQAIPLAPPTQSLPPTPLVASEAVHGLAAPFAFMHEGTDAPRRCAPADLPPQCVKPEGHHALRRAPRMVEYQTALDSLSSKEVSGRLVTTGPLSEKPGEHSTGRPDNALSSMSPAQASLSTQRTTVLRL